MKQVLVVACAAALATSLWIGCGGKKEEPPPSPPATAQTPPSVPAPPVPPPPPATPAAPPVQQALVDIQADINKAMALAKEGKHAEALVILQGLAAKQNLTGDQKTSIENAIAQIKQWAAEAVAKSVTEKSPISLPKSLPLK